MTRSSEADRYGVFIRLSTEPPARWEDAVFSAFPDEPDAREEVLGLLGESTSSEPIQLVSGSVRYAAGACLGLLLRFRRNVH